MKIADAVYISEHGAKIGVEKSALTIRTPDGEKTRIPMASIERVVILGRASISNQAMARCTSAGIRITAMHASGRIRFVVGGPTSGNVLLRVGQVRAADDVDRSLRVAKNIVAGKIQNSRSTLQRWSWESKGIDRELLKQCVDQLGDRLHGLLAAKDHDTVRGYEGESARQYFKGLGNYLNPAATGFRFDQRSRRPPRDPANALLSFVYGLLVTEAVGAIESVGLDPQIGFLHGMRPGRPSLALDLIEELRSPFADRFVVSVVRRRQIRLEHLDQLPGGAWRLTKEGLDTLLQRWEEFRRDDVPHPFLDRLVPRWAVSSTQATLMARFLRGDLAEYPPWIATT